MILMPDQAFERVKRSLEFPVPSRTSRQFILTAVLEYGKAIRRELDLLDEVKRLGT